MPFEYSVEFLETWLSGFYCAKGKTQWQLYEWFFVKLSHVSYWYILLIRVMNVLEGYITFHDWKYRFYKMLKYSKVFHFYTNIMYFCNVKNAKYLKIAFTL